MSMSLSATVVVPTTADRGPLLPYSVGSILDQTVEDLEVFVIGDGVTPATRSIIRDLRQQDARIRFFDHPKDVRRGERYRHAALTEARGRIVCYLCDRDLMLPDHVETMSGLLADADFAHTLRYSITPDGQITFKVRRDIMDHQQRRTTDVFQVQTPLSMAAHTMTMYRRLPYGWRTTPPGVTTDNYMWHQILQQPDCEVAASRWPTILYFKRGDHPGWPVSERLAELKKWAGYMKDEEWVQSYRDHVRDQAIQYFMERSWHYKNRLDRLSSRWWYRLAAKSARYLRGFSRQG